MAKTSKPVLFECRECGKKFFTVAAAERASFGDRGCPKCGGSDIDVPTVRVLRHHATPYQTPAEHRAWLAEGR
jgi:Zn finger protein HypA/HybF involved in hydrogenase expression